MNQDYLTVKEAAILLDVDVGYMYKLIRKYAISKYDRLGVTYLKSNDIKELNKPKATA